jgi:hypothetical protein
MAPWRRTQARSQPAASPRGARAAHARTRRTRRAAAPAGAIDACMRARALMMLADDVHPGQRDEVCIQIHESR